LLGTAATANSAVGDYAIVAALGTLASDFNYSFQFANGTLRIDPATLTYATQSTNRSYGSANPVFSGTLTGFVNGETQATATGGTLAFTSPATPTSKVGSYAINGSGLTANNGNYSFVQAAGNATALTIDPATLTYVANAAARTYGSVNPVFSGTVTGFANGETQATATGGTLGFTSPATVASNAGRYAINGSGLTADNGNYNFVQAAGNAGALTINPATLTYTANAASRTYGSVNPAFSGTVSGFVNGESQAAVTSGAIAFTSPATAASRVGSYAINGSGLTAITGNYNFAQAAGNAVALRIDPATLTAGLTGSVSKIYDGTDAATLTPNNYTLAGAVQGDNVVLNNPTDGRYDDKEAGTGKLVTVLGLALVGGDAGNYALASTQASGAIGIITAPIDNGILPSTQTSGAITVPVIDNGILVNLIGHPVSNTPVAAPAAAGPAIIGNAGVGASDATSATSNATSATTSQIGEEPTPATAVANTVGQSLSGAPGSVPSFTNVLIQGLLRQFDPPPGAARPRAVPPVDQIYSSWGNEAFWQ
jgi:glutamine cyclotransferase